jgi:PAS domain S-box-containing protein
VLGDSISFVPEESLAQRDELRERLLAGEVIMEIETKRLRKDGSLVDVELSAGPVYDGSGRILRFMAVSADVSSRKRAQEELRHERDFISTLVDMAPVLVIVFDREGRLLRYNRECERLTGYSLESVAGRHFMDLFVPSEEVESVRRALERVWAGEFPATNENHWLTRDGRRRLIFWSNAALLDERGEVEYIVSAGIDITERKQAEEELRASRARIVEAGDAERRRLERNLHDGAQQRLVSVSVSLRLAQTWLEQDGSSQVLEVLSEANEELGLALEELRELARGIHPAALTERGLGPALASLANRASVPVEVEGLPPERLPDQVEAAAYYVVSEALANVAKHAEASSVTVRFGRDNGQAVVEVVDDGVGGANPGRGSGLHGLADRIESLDGYLRIESPPGEGTTIRAEIPCR